MPTVAVNKLPFLSGIGHPEMTDDDVDILLFGFGLELDEVTSEKELLAKEKGAAADTSGLSDAVIYKIDVPANRYDLLCLEGLVRGIKVFERTMAPPRYVAVPPAQMQEMVVEKETASVRPYIVCAVLRNIQFTEQSYASFIDLQDKLHTNICRKRTLASMGTHDLDTITGPFRYKAMNPRDICFTALKQTQEMSADVLMDVYQTDPQLRHFLHIIDKSPLFPVIYDSNGVVLSLPPIINSEHSKITLDTRNVFIDCTATDKSKASIVVNTLVAMFSQYCEVPFSFERVNVVYEATGVTEALPTMEYRKEIVPVAYLNKRVGISETAEVIAGMLGRMCLASHSVQAASAIEVEVPPTRADILHACDIMEDVGIAFGYDNIEKTLPETATIGKQQPLNKLTDLVRSEMAMCGFTEALTFALCSRDESFKFLRHEYSADAAVTIANPATYEFQMARIDLAPGILKTIASNRSVALPLKVFEVSDVVLRDGSSDTGARNERRVCAAYYGTTSGMETIHGIIDRLFQVMGVPYDVETGYSYRESSDPMFLPGRGGSILHKGQQVGQFGVLHPLVLHMFNLTQPTSLMEINAEIFL